MRIEITIDEWRHFHFWKHGVAPGSPWTDAIDASRAIVGLHSARIPSLPVSLRSRIGDFSYERLYRLMVVDRQMIKLRCMRKTLHTVPLDLAPIVHRATLGYRTVELRNWFQSVRFSKRRLRKSLDWIENVCSPEPVSYTSLIERVTDHVLDGNWRGERAKCLARKLVKFAWESGNITYQDCSRTWDNEDKRFVSTKAAFPSLDLDGPDFAAAETDLIHRYFSAFGPATVNDASWWSGLSKGKVAEAIRRSSGAIGEYVGFKQCGETMYSSAAMIAELDDFRGCPNRKTTWVALLAHEDPCLKGYFDSRYRYVLDGDYTKLFNMIGEARSSIVVNGLVCGVWSFNRVKRTIEYSLFVEVDSGIRHLLATKILEMEQFLNDGAAQQQFEF